MPLTSTFPDVMFVVFMGSEPSPILSACYPSEALAKHYLEHLTTQYPLTSFGFCKYIRCDAPAAEPESVTDPPDT